MSNHTTPGRMGLNPTEEEMKEIEKITDDLIAGADLVKLVQIFLGDRILAVGNEVQTTLHAIDSGFFFIARGIAIQDMPDAVA